MVTALDGSNPHLTDSEVAIGSQRIGKFARFVGRENITIVR